MHSTSNNTFEGLMSIVSHLRGVDGCPWDREQTHSSLRNNLLEECHETLEALDNGNIGNLVEELGDLIIQIVFHCQIAEDLGEFDSSAMFETVIAKLVRRHPHVFGSIEAKNAIEVEENWEKIKARERGSSVSPLKSVPKSLPSLAFGQAISHRAERNGLDFFKGTPPKTSKLLKGLIRQEESNPGSLKESKFGEILFTLIQIGRSSGIDAESALRKTNNQFQHQFDLLNKVLNNQGRTMKDLSETETENFWRKVLT